MQRNTIAEMRQIIDAFEQGKKVQFRRVDGSDEWVDYALDTPDFFTHCYRIKPEEPKKKWRPFKDAKEMFLASNSQGYLVYVKRKEHKDTLLISGFNDNEVYITANGWKNVESLLEYYTFADGTPCGVEEDA